MKTTNKRTLAAWIALVLILGAASSFAETVLASDNGYVREGFGVLTQDQTLLKAKAGWLPGPPSTGDRMSYVRFYLSGPREFGGYAAANISSVSLDLWIVSSEGDEENDLEVYALVDGADFDGGSSDNWISESQWTSSAGAHPLTSKNLPQGNVHPSESDLATDMLGKHTFQALGDNAELGKLTIELSAKEFKKLIENDTNGEITLILTATTDMSSIDIASLNNGTHPVPALTVVGSSARVGFYGLAAGVLLLFRRRD